VPHPEFRCLAYGQPGPGVSRSAAAENVTISRAPMRDQRHNPKTVRKNVGEDYRGRLRIDVRRSSGLYRQIEGWAEAIMSAREAE